MIYRDGQRIVPHGNTQLKADDVLFLIGSRENMEGLDEILDA
jgi:Trk K+ transport system NAD-binding subunit